MKIKLSEKVKLNIQAEYCAFIDKYIDRFPAEHSGIYLYCVKNSAVKDIDTKEVASVFNKNENDILALLNYLAILDITEAKGNSMVIKGSISEGTPIGLIKRPEYGPEEIEFSRKNNPEIKFLLKKTETMLGKMLTHKDIETIYCFFDFYKLPVDVILFLIDFCLSRNKRRMSYIESTAINWAENGINTIEKAKDWLICSYPENKEILDILKAMCISGRFITASESELIDKWKKEYGFSIEMIIHACETTVSSIGKASFKYADKILERWYKNGIKTIDEAKKESEEYSAKQQKDKEKKNSKNQFTNFSNQRKYDYSSLEKMMFKKHKSTEDK